MIKHSTEKPPNWGRICAVFGVEKMWDKGLLVTYGDTYYSKFETTPDLIAHESTHTRQQEAYGGPEKWWERYFGDPIFRLEQEVEAYRNQVKWLQDHTEGMSRDERRWRIKHCAESLSSGMYGAIISYDKALALIKS